METLISSFRMKANDEMGGLIRDIQSAANRLKLFLAQATSFAVTEMQLDTAKAIQADFLN